MKDAMIMEIIPMVGSWIRGVRPILKISGIFLLYSQRLVIIEIFSIIMANARQRIVKKII